MTSTIGNHLLSLLKRNETLWPNPEASTGIFYRQMGRSCCWEAVGPAREVFIQIADEIKSHLEKSSDPVSHTVTWTIYMIGRTRERAKPTIMFCCQVPGPRKRVRKMIEESDILSKYPGIVTGDSTRPPDFDQLVQLTKSERIEYLGLSKAKMRKFIFYEPSKDVCGVHIHVKYSDYPDVLPRKATIGGILRAGDKYLCLTVAHAFTDKDQFQSSEATNNSNFEYDVDGQSDTDEDDVDMVDTTSRGSRTPEYAESPESQVTTMSMDSSTVASSQIQQPQSPSNITELALETSAAKRAEVLLSEEHNRVARRNMQIDLKEIWDASVLTSTNGPRPGLDYALIETTLPDFQTFNQFHSTKLSSQHLPYPERIAFTRPEPDTEVFAATASKGAVEGTISGTPTFMQTPSSNSIQELWTVRLFGSLENGDCGSWVVSRESGDVYGHIVAGSPESGVAYVVPAHQVYADVKARFNLDLRLSARDLEADNRESNGLTLSEVPSVERNKLQMMESDQNNATFPPLLSSSRLDFDLMPPGDENQSQYHGPPMDRNTISSSSTESSWSTGFSQGQGDVASALSSYSNPSSDGGLSRRGYQYEQPQNGYLSPEPAEPPRKSSIGLPLFNIERDGDPRIEWTMYYDFMVTKAEAYYQLQPSYLPTKKYPSRIKSEKVLIDGEKFHPCRAPNCKAKPFTRHYDLERHFKIHRGDEEQVYCDYKKCPHKEPFRKDHCREHYREYHAEDLIKRSLLNHNKPKHGQRLPETVEEFLAARLNNINPSWWRCSKCIQRVQVNDHRYTCPKCNVACEPIRVAWREKVFASGKNSQATDSNTGFGLAQPNYRTACGQCENTWLPDKIDPKLRVSCPRCRPTVFSMDGV